MATESMTSQVRDAIRRLNEVQEIDDELADITLERGNLPEELEKLSAKIREFETFIGAKRNEQIELERMSGENEQKLAVSRDKLTKYQQQLYAVKTTREYDAITNETDTAKKEIAEYEMFISNAITRTVELTRVVEERSAELEAVRANQEAKTEELKQKLAETEGEERELTSRRAEIAGGLRKMLLAHYERIRDAKDGRGIVKLTGDACGGCFALIPPQTRVEIRKYADIHLCESCGRFLVPENE